MTQTRSDIVEAMARELLGRVNAPEQEIYRVAGDLTDIALKAAAEIARDNTPGKRESTLAAHVTGQNIKRAILALTSEGTKP